MQAAGIVDSDLLFRVGVHYGYRSGGQLKPGEYAFEPRVSMYEVMDTLRSGRGVVHKVSLPEGLTSKQIFDKLAADEVLVGPLPEEIPVEGSLMPDTYPFQRGTTREEIIKQMMRAQQRVINDVWSRRDRDLPIKASLQTGSALPWLSSDPNAPAVPVTLRGNIGQARLSFDGEVRDLLVSQGLAGDYTLSGPSLAAVGEPLGVTLPTTPAFSMRGRLTREGTRWTTAVRQATIGKSQLSGEFQYDKPENAVPTLTGELRGRELWLADLGPAVGVPAEPGAPRAKKAASRVLPDKQFDLPSLRAMNANVNVKLARFESGSALLQAAEPLNARIVLQDGVLELRDIDARVARGQVAGLMRLDGREPKAQWRARLRVSGVHLEQWLNLERKNGQRWVTGVMGGRIALDGVGRSTAELLASADGRMVLYWTDGTVSHLVVEAAGIDIAQGLGLLVRGDDALQVNCGVADLRVKDGMVTPRPMVVDTKDSVVLVDGDMSLATERLNLVAKVDPKDKSPLTLRTPLNIQGTLGDPRLSLQKAPLLRKLVPAAVLGVAVAPLAAIVPLIDLGEDPDDESLRALSECNARLAPVSKRRPGS